jgi:hypothetical protein
MLCIAANAIAGGFGSKRVKKNLRIQADLNLDMKPGFVIFIDLLIMELVIILAALYFLETVYLLRRANIIIMETPEP